MASTRRSTGKPMGGTGTDASRHLVAALPPVHRFHPGLAQRSTQTGGWGEIGAMRSKGLVGGGSG
ncbi:MAG: hypothetical protein M3N68_14520 [Actinomycetota bacterium]|nr:hypothetical protein [Actinomycetota bacterium]